MNRIEISFNLNGKELNREVKVYQTLLDFLRKDSRINSVKKGCENGECGACTVLLDGKPVNSCLVLVPQIAGKKVETIEGLAEDEKMKRLQRAFLEKGAVQCGYCTPGMLISLWALSQENPNPTLKDVQTAIEGNLCRCTGYKKIFDAVLNKTKDSSNRMRAKHGFSKT